MLGGLDSAMLGQRSRLIKRLWKSIVILVEGQAIKHGMLNIHPDEIWSGRSKDLCQESTGDALSDAEQGLFRILLSFFQSLFKVSRIGQER